MLTCEVTWSFANLCVSTRFFTQAIYSLIIYRTYLNIWMFHEICMDIRKYPHPYIYIHIHLYSYTHHERTHNITCSKRFHLLDSLLRIFVSERIWEIDNVLCFHVCWPEKTLFTFLAICPKCVLSKCCYIQSDEIRGKLFVDMTQKTSQRDPFTLWPFLRH
jgi:hypothetical protein